MSHKTSSRFDGYLIFKEFLVSKAFGREMKNRANVYFKTGTVNLLERMGLLRGMAFIYTSVLNLSKYSMIPSGFV